MVTLCWVKYSALQQISQLTITLSRAIFVIHSQFTNYFSQPSNIALMVTLEIEGCVSWLSVKIEIMWKPGWLFPQLFHICILCKTNISSIDLPVKDSAWRQIVCKQWTKWIKKTLTGTDQYTTLSLDGHFSYSTHYCLINKMRKTKDTFKSRQRNELMSVIHCVVVYKGHKNTTAKSLFPILQEKIYIGKISCKSI